MRRSLVLPIVVVLAGLCAMLGPTSAASSPEVPAAPRSPIVGERFYFVMTDRYIDGDPNNNTGGKAGPISVTGYEPTSDGYFHGGDLRGLIGRCDIDDPTDHGLARIARLGFTALWITPPFVQRTVQGDSAAYHGYWFLDLSRPDPHLGEREDMAALMACARKLDLKVFLDVVVNHTADVITYPQGNAYVPISSRPYRTAQGRIFKPFRYARGTSFPELSPTRSFPKTPIVPEDFRDAKAPAFLNDVTKYHNRGDIDWGSCTGVCEMDGDFVGLDDLMTEDYSVVSGLASAYGAWISDFGVDGFRLDTAKHVDPYFFGRWLPMIQQQAVASGKPDFTTFAEVWETDPVVLSETMIRRQLPSVLDFPFQDAVRAYANGRASGRTLELLFADDDLYTTATTSAAGLATFLGNHDMGRIGFFLRTQSVDDHLLERSTLAHSILYLTRGVPIVYYGDEVGMTGSGDGRDKRARQDMFPTQVPTWQSEPRIGSDPIGQGSSFDVDNALEGHLRDLATLREEYPALAEGAQVARTSQDAAVTLSRIDFADRREFLVAFNSGESVAQLTSPTSTPDTTWTPVFGGGDALRSDGSGNLAVAVPPRSTVVWRADAQMPGDPNPQVSVRVSRDRATDRVLLTAATSGTDPSRVAFYFRSDAESPWTYAGTDEAPPYRVYLDTAALGLDGSFTVMAAVQSTSGAVAHSAPRQARTPSAR